MIYARPGIHYYNSRNEKLSIITFVNMNQIFSKYQSNTNPNTNRRRTQIRTRHETQTRHEPKRETTHELKHEPDTNPDTNYEPRHEPRTHTNPTRIIIELRRNFQALSSYSYGAHRNIYKDIGFIIQSLI